MDPERRGSLRSIWIGLVAIATGQAGWIAASFLKPRHADARESALFVAGQVDHFEAGTVTAFPEGKFYLVRLADGGFLALHRECTHLGCTVPWDPTQKKFVCPCHASQFDITGEVLAAPAPRPLDTFAVRLENGLVKIDLSRRLPRQAFDASQVAS